MTSEPSSSPVTDVSTGLALAKLFDRADVLFAISHLTRVAMLRELADGSVLSVNDIARRLGRAEDATSKNLRILRNARLILAVNPPGEDGRKQYYELPAVLRGKDAGGALVMDVGFVVLRFI